MVALVPPGQEFHWAQSSNCIKRISKNLSYPLFRSGIKDEVKQKHIFINTLNKLKHVGLSDLIL